jgi:hypothetical protein
MKPIQNPPPPPIGPNSDREAVANLHEALFFLIDCGRFQLPDEVRDELRIDRNHAAYRDATARTMIIFREQFGLEGGEVVDEATAEVLNRMLEELSAFTTSGQSVGRLCLIGGRVRAQDGTPFAGRLVRAFHEEERGVIRLGEDTTDAEGRYTIRYEWLPEMNGAKVRVSALDDTGRTIANSDPFDNAGFVQVTDLIVPVVQPLATERRIEGRIAFDRGMPAESLTLRLYRLGFGGAATRLAETTTFDHGVYSLPYEADGRSASLEVRAVDASGREVALSKIIRNPGEREALNLVAPGETRPLAAEFKRLSGDLQRQLEDLRSLRTAREDAERQDLTLLHESTGWDARLIATAAMAVRLSARDETGLPQEALYGLLRLGLPSDKLQLARVSGEAFTQALDKARSSGIIQFGDDDAQRLKDDFEAFSVKTRLALAAPGSKATYGQFLDKADLDATAQKKFAKVFLNHRGDSASLWQKAADEGLGEVVPKLKKQGKLAFLTTNNLELTQKLQTDLGESGPEELVQKGLYRKEAWLDLIEGVPSAYAGAENPKEAYAADMARKVRISYSTEVAWDMIRTGELAIEGGNENLSAFLKNAVERGFKLGQTAIDPFITANPEVFEGIPDADQQTTREMVKALQRVYQITPGNDAMKTLLGAGLLSAQDVLAYPLDVFLERFVSPSFPKEQARLVYRKAEQVGNLSYSLFSLAKELDNAPPLFAIAGPPAAREAAKQELVKRFPTMESLFGSLDYGECEECRSVLSPAAYLVDLLQFLDRDPAVWQNTLKDWKAKHGNASYPFKNLAARDSFLERWEATHPGEPPPNTELTPYEILIGRRPDLPHIPLTCENTNTALPQIDFVNEILEYFVANRALDAKAARDTGDATSAELLAEPAYVLSEAYATLQAARYSLVLPFDLPIETVRAFASYFEVPLWQLLETLRRHDDLFALTEPYDRAAVFFESVGLSPSEIAIFANPKPLTEWFQLYGFKTAAEALEEGVHPDTGQRIDLHSAKALSRRLGVTYHELTDIIRTGFVNPRLGEVALLDKLGVSIADVRFYIANKAFYDQNEDLVGKRRSDLGPADQQRFDNLAEKLPESSMTGWDVVNEVAAFEQRLDALAVTSSVPRNTLQTALQAAALDRILVLADATAGGDFDKTGIEYASGRKVNGIALLRINLFVRLWRKLGWSIAETDRALTAFVPAAAPFDDAADHLAKQPLRTALIYLAHLQALDKKLKAGQQSRAKLTTLWSDLPTNGRQSLYATLFLTPSARRSAEVEIVVGGQPRRLSPFDDPLGRYLDPARLGQLADQVRYEVRLPGITPANQINPAAFAGEERVTLRYDELGEIQFLSYVGILTDAEKNRLAALAPSDTLSRLLTAVQAEAAEFRLIKGNQQILQGALGVTAEEISAILKDAGLSLEKAELSLPNVSILYRYGLLARALSLSVAELIALKQLSGLDPFKPLEPGPLPALENDHPYWQTLRFVEAVEAVRESGAKVADLDYLLRHRFDETGKYRTNRDATLAWLKSLVDGLAAIRIEHAAPADLGALGGDLLRQKLGLVLSGDVVEPFLALVNGTGETTVIRPTASEDQLKPADFAGETVFRISPYNAAKEEQAITLRGPLSNSLKAELKTRFNERLAAGQRTVFAELLDEVQKGEDDSAEQFFAKNLERGNVSPARGFLSKEEFTALREREFQAPANLPADQLEASRQASENRRKQIIAGAFFPYLQRRLSRQFLIQKIAASTAADSALVESLLTDAGLLAANKTQLLAAFEALGTRGVDAVFYDSLDLRGAAQPTVARLTSADTALKPQKDEQGNPLNPANSARFEGALMVPTPGAYRFTIELEKQGSKAELSFSHLPKPVFVRGTASTEQAILGSGPREFLELKPGTLYRFTLTLKNLSGGRARILVESETQARDDLSRLAFCPAASLDDAEDAILLLTKALQLVQMLGLSHKEVGYLAAHAADFGYAGIPLSDLPVGTLGDTGSERKAVIARFGWFLRLAAYVRLKRDLAGESDDLIDVFAAQATGQLDEAVYPLIARLTRRDETIVKETARALADAPSFANEEPLARLWEALQVVERFGVPVSSLKEWTRIVDAKTSPAQRSEIASHLKEAIKARFGPDHWPRVAQPIFDKLRARQRDALVAHVMHQNGFDRLEQLFEFFLIDPGVEPVVQTSRIRSAIAAVQIFIHRCLLNLEPEVAAAAINSRQWQWMKRYPVWAGNRKLWLFPENVLEPEFRDDKTHLFSELEGKLLQSDVSDDVAEDAFFIYLKKLEQLARLDIVAMYCEEQPLDPASNRLHVIGRTYTEPCRYFYRRYAHEMWTPWEPMPVEIEGNHIVPVVWRERLHVFWVTFLDNPDPDSGPSDEDLELQMSPSAVVLASASEKALSVGSNKKNPAAMKLTELSLGKLAVAVRSSMAQKLVKVQLHWSEYFQGEWSVRESGGFSASLNRKVPLDFESASVFIHATKEFEKGEERSVKIHLGGAINQAFQVVSRNCRPIRATRETPPAMPYNASQVQANRYRGSGAFKVTFTQRIETEAGKPPKTATATPSILQQGTGFTVLPCANPISLATPEVAPLVTPLFYQDEHSNTFFVQPEFKEKTIEEWQEWVTRTPEPEVDWDRPDWWDKIVVKPLVPELTVPVPVNPDDPLWQTKIDPRARFQMAAGQDWLANPQTVVQFDGELVGAAGRAGLAIQPSFAESSLDTTTPAISVAAGSALRPGEGIFIADITTLAAAGISQGDAGINIVGAGGLNSALLKNLSGFRSF